MSAPEIRGYADLTPVGRGGFATVYRARQVAFNRPAAVKVLGGSGTDESKVARFERECAAIGALSGHPHVVAVYDAGVTLDGSPYLSMEYLPRGSLADRLRLEGPLPATEVLRIGVQLADAVQVAHAAGVLHRDIKPENVLVDASGQCKIGDFGIAAVAGSSDTATGTILGTVLHTAPEVLEGGKASVASDVYSLGSTLATLLLGRAPFAGDGDDSVIPVMMRVVRDPLPDLRAVGVPDPVAAVVELAMDKRPANRFESAAALGNALQQVLGRSGPIEPGGGTSDAHPTLPPQSAAAFASTSALTSGAAGAQAFVPAPAADDIAASSVTTRRPRRRWAWALVGLVVLAAGAGAGFVISGRDDGSSPTTTAPVRTVSTTPPATEPATTVPPLTLAEARTLVAAKGFRVSDDSAWRQGPLITALVGSRADGREQLFFFAKGKLLGRDFAQPSWRVRITNFTDTDVEATYSLYGAGQDADCCSPTGRKAITFHYDGSTLVPLNGPFPPVDRSIAGHR